MTGTNDARRDTDASTLYPAVPTPRRSARGKKSDSAGNRLPRGVQTKTLTAWTRLVSSTMIYRSFDCVFVLSRSFLLDSDLFRPNYRRNIFYNFDITIKCYI